MEEIRINILISKNLLLFFYFRKIKNQDR